LEDWSKSIFKDSFTAIEDMQRAFRRIIREVVSVNIVGCYATKPTAKYDLVSKLFALPSIAK
jgi:hypothetical protein